MGALLSGVLLAGCFGGGSSSEQDSGSGPSQGPTLPDAGPPVDGGVLTINDASDAPTLDPHKSATAYTGQAVSGIVYSKLVKYKTDRVTPYEESMQVEPDLAESWTHSDDGLVWTFNLRKGVKFQDVAPVSGREFTSADVACTIDRIKTLPGVQLNLVSIVDKIATPDDYTVEVTLTEPYAAFDETMASFYMAILPCEGTRGEFDLAQTAIGTGPFVLQKWDRKQQRTYVKNPDYFVKGLPHLDGVNVMIIADPAAAIAAFRTNQLDITAVSETLMPTVTSTKPETIIRPLMGTTITQVFMNQAVAPFDNLKVRQAVAMALDRKGQADTFSGAGYRLSGPVPSTLFGGLSTDDIDELQPYDSEAAKKLLAEAGFPNGFKVKMTATDGYGPGMVNQAQWVQEDLKRIGIETELRILDYATYWSTMAAEDYEITFTYSSGFMTADEFLSANWLSNGARNWSNVDDPKLDAMIVEQRGILDRDDREKKLHDISRYILENLSNPVHEFQYTSLMAQQPYVNDYWPHPQYARDWVAKTWLGPDAPGRN
jgi:peptide/nickel transport system substrate-binding protein